MLHAFPFVVSDFFPSEASDASCLPLPFFSDFSPSAASTVSLTNVKVVGLGREARVQNVLEQTLCLRDGMILGHQPLHVRRRLLNVPTCQTKRKKKAKPFVDMI